MSKRFPWKRFWCRRDASYTLGDSGFLFDPDAEHGAALNPHLTTLDRLQEIPCLALLGEPGIGKSWSLRVDVDAFLKRTPNLQAMRLDLRSFGSEERLYSSVFEAPVFRRWVEGDHELHLYLDSFDECLLRIDTVASMLADELPKYPLNRLKLRIASRTATWPALLDRALEEGYGKGNYSVVELVPLRRVDVLEAATLTGLPDGRAFLERIDDLQIAALAGKPITLNMLLGTYARDGDLPTDLISLYKKGCLILCEEQNQARRAAGLRGTLHPAERMAVAARLAAVTQLGNRYAVWTGTEAEGAPQEDVSVSELLGGTEAADQAVPVTADAVLETLGTGLFSSRGQERLGWSHQTFAEYLAARYCLGRGLTIEQLRSLVFHPRRARVIPQVREVASWLALQNEQLFQEIAEADPEVLLGSAAPSLSAEQRRVLTDALLNNSDRNEILHLHHNLVLRNLLHPGLAEQLEAVLQNRTRPEGTRYFAAKIVRDCKVEGVAQTMLAIALSDDETHEMRSIAAYAVADIGAEAEREQMRPLLTLSREMDPNDQLRGAALNAIYPGDKYDHAMWDYLEHPRKPLFFGDYNNFVSYVVVPKLNGQNLPAALRWCMQQPKEEIGPLAELEASIFVLAVEHVREEGVAELLAAAVFERCRSYRGFPNRRHNKQKGAEQLLLEDDERRRRFLEAFLPLLNAENVHLVFYPLTLLVQKDLDWYIERVVMRISPNPITEAKLIPRLTSSWEPELVRKVWDACEQDEVIRAACHGLFDPMPLDSESAKWERRTHADILKEKGIETAPAMGPRVEAALAKSEAGDVDEWLRLLYEMSIKEGEARGLDFRGMKLLDLPGWVDASEQIKSRISGAAKRYLSQSTFPDSEPARPNSVRNGASAGVNALWLLQLIDPQCLEEQKENFWARWIPALLEDGRAGDNKVPEIEAVVRLASNAAPETMKEELLAQIERENAGEQKHLFCSAIIERAWSDSLGAALLEKLQRNDLHASVQGTLLRMLLIHETPGARKWAEEVVRSDHASDRGMAVARALLHAGEQRAWPVIWPAIQSDTAFGRELLESVSYGRSDGASFSAGFTESELEALYIWLTETYPPTEDRVASGAIGPVDTIRFLRDGSLEVLKKRGTFAACDAIARVELRFPGYRWMRYHFDEAEVLACALTWEAPAAGAILAMANDRSKRFVESSNQLLDAISESLSRLQAELHGELAAVGDLWNSRKDEWWPKQEEDVSDYIARFLRRDLAESGVVVNREVQIRRGRAGEMPGQDTDIYVSAPVPQGSSGSHDDGVQVILEVKGTWNDGLMIDMERQLRDRYLRNSNCRTGLYVAVHFKADSWGLTDHRRAKSDRRNIGELRDQLSAQALSLSGSTTIKSFVLDARLDSTTATGIEAGD